MKARIIVSAIIRKEDHFLFGKKAENIGPYPNTWHLIGGGVNLEEETLEEAIRREVKEEAGIEIDDLKMLSFDEGNEPNKHGEMTHYVFLVYDTNYKSGKIKAGDDIKELKWFKAEEIGDISLPKPTEKVLKALNLI